MISELKKILIGSPLPNWEYKHQRLSKKVALAVFSSDAMSSVAYATEEIALVLIAAGAAALSFSLPISMVILVLLWVLIVSYRQTIEAYPNGGGAYIVAKDNLGTIPGLVAASALLLDYILTVAVSVAAGVAAVTSAFPELYPDRILIGVFVVFFITLMNLKGVKESGLLFSVPTYMFIVSFVGMVLFGFFRYATGTLPHFIIQTHTEVFASLSVFLLFRAFSSGCAALTGIEAISNGVPAFKEPESKNARTTLLVMAFILSSLFFGITFLAYNMHITPVHDRTMVSQIAEGLFGRTAFYYVIQAFTMLILFLAANTSFADFPRLSYFLAKDSYLPRQFTRLGDRLVFSNGIVFLGIASSVLLVLFSGSVHHLIPLYAVGVFTSFTLSQAGMVRRHFKMQEKNWQRNALINTAGMLMTGVALVIIAVSKFVHGAWIIVVLIVLLVLIFQRIHAHYANVAEELSIAKIKKIKWENGDHMLVVFVPSLHKGIIKAINFAKTFCTNIEAVHVNISKSETEKLYKYWKKHEPGIPLKVIESPYRKLMEPLMEYLDHIEKKNPNLNVTVVISEFVPKHWWEHLLHNQTGWAIKAKIHFRKRTNFISIQYHLEK